MSNSKKTKSKKPSSEKKKKVKFELKKIKKIPIEKISEISVFAICAYGPTSTYTAGTTTCSDSCGGATFCC